MADVDGLISIDDPNIYVLIEKESKLLKDVN